MGCILEVSFARVLGGLFQASDGFAFENLELLAYLIISYFVELFCFLVIHSTLYEDSGCGL